MENNNDDELNFLTWDEIELLEKKIAILQEVLQNDDLFSYDQREDKKQLLRELVDLFMTIQLTYDEDDSGEDDDDDSGDDDDSKSPEDSPKNYHKFKIFLN
jgi:hypothetical protein